MFFIFPSTSLAPVVSLTSHAATRFLVLVTDHDFTMKIHQREMLGNPSERIQLKALGLCQCMVIPSSIVNRTTKSKKETVFNAKL